VRRITTQTDVTPVIFGCWGQTEDVRASMDNPLNDYEHLRPQKPQNGRPRNGFIQKRGDHFDRFVTNHRPKTATPGVAGSLTDIMEMHLHVWRVSRVQNAHVWRGTAPPFAIPSHVPPKARLMSGAGGREGRWLYTTRVEPKCRQRGTRRPRPVAALGLRGTHHEAAELAETNRARRRWRHRESSSARC
jgi:hypothetical protein